MKPRKNPLNKIIVKFLPIGKVGVLKLSLKELYYTHRPLHINEGVFDYTVLILLGQLSTSNGKYPCT